MTIELKFSFFAHILLAKVLLFCSASLRADPNMPWFNSSKFLRHLVFRRRNTNCFQFLYFNIIKPLQKKSFLEYLLPFLIVIEDIGHMGLVSLENVVLH